MDQSNIVIGFGVMMLSTEVGNTGAIVHQVEPFETHEDALKFMDNHRHWECGFEMYNVTVTSMDYIRQSELCSGDYVIENGEVYYINKWTVYGNVPWATADVVNQRTGERMNRDYDSSAMFTITYDRDAHAM